MERIGGLHIVMRLYWVHLMRARRSSLRDTANPFDQSRTVPGFPSACLCPRSGERGYLVHGITCEGRDEKPPAHPTKRNAR
jgi:hypothetical protein